MSVITIGIDPTIELGPVTIAWHGLMIAVGILVGGIVVAYDARRRGLDPERVYAIGLILVVGAIVFAIAWPLRKRLQPRPLTLTWLVLALLAVGRFIEFFVRSDSADLALGLEIAQ